MNAKNPPNHVRAGSGSGPAQHEDAVAVLHDLYAAYPGERHAVLAQALFQARRNIYPRQGYDAVQREVGRLLAGATQAGRETPARKAFRRSTDATVRLC
jgi:hypothetical protein